MKTATFEKLAKTITANAGNYRTKRACGLAIGRVKAAWRSNGGYGSRAYLYEAAVSALQDRWIELNGREHDARMAALLAE